MKSMIAAVNQCSQIAVFVKRFEVIQNCLAKTDGPYFP